MKIFTIVVALGVLVAFAMKLAGQDKRSKERARGWRVRCLVAGRWAYEELEGEIWRGVTFDELGDIRESPHIVDVQAADRWATFPDWARDRRDLIIARLKVELREPHYVIRTASAADPTKIRAGSAVGSRLVDVEKRPVI